MRTLMPGSLLRNRLNSMYRLRTHCAQNYRQLARLIHTLQHLKLRQLYFLLLRRAIKPIYTAPLRVANTNPQFVMQAHSLEQQCVAKDHFIFLNVLSPFTIKTVDWHPAGMSKLWRYNLHYFDYLNGPDEKHNTAHSLDKSMRDFLIQHWIDQNPYPQEDAWEPYPTSLRIINWIKYFHSFQQGTIAQAWLNSLYQQGHYLSRHIEWHIDANHLLKNIIALVIWSHYFNDECAQRWRVRSLAWLADNCKEQFLADGGHYERSPMYHFIVLHHLLDAYNCLKNTCGTAPHWLSETLTCGLIYCQIIVKPDGRLPHVKDSADAIAPSLIALKNYAQQLGIWPSSLLKYVGGDVLARQIWRKNRSLHAVNEDFFAKFNAARASKVVFQQAASGHQIQTSYYLQSSGYFIVKSAADYILFDVGTISPAYQPGHSHCDALHLEVVWNGRDIFTDSGVFNYVKSAERHYARSVRAHNTLAINNREQHDIWDAFRIAQRGHTEDIKTGPLFCCAEFYPYFSHKRNIGHKRAIEINPAGGIHITDSLLGTGVANAEIFWHLAPGLRPHQATTDLDNNAIEIRDEQNLLVAVIKLQHNQVISIFTQSECFPEFGKRQLRHCVILQLNNAQLPTQLTYQIHKSY